MSKQVFIFIIFFMGMHSLARAVPPPLERIVSIKITNATIPAVLESISKQGDFSFSYNTALVDRDKKITLDIHKKTVRFVLTKIFGNTVIFQNKNNHIILSKNKKQEPVTIEPKYILIRGYVLNQHNSTIQGVSLFEEKTLYAAVTDHFGYFSLQLPYSTLHAHITVSKKGFRDTTLQIEKSNFELVEIKMKEKKQSPVQIPNVNTTLQPKTINDTIPLKDASQQEGLRRFGFLLGKKMKSNLSNITDTFFRQAQFSVVPGISTNRLVGPNVINNYSFNVLAGYSRGVKYFELGGLVNINRENAGNVQIGGLGNITGGNVNGLQLSGIINTCHDTVTGVQLAGVINTNKLKTRGAQVAGVVNTSKHVTGAQIAGTVNWAQQVSGIQISGFMNYARNMKGVQLAPFNFADTCDGVPIGFFSYVKHGYHKIELSADEIFYTNIAFRTGTDKFHNIFTAGIQYPNGSNTLWTYGYGIGTSFNLSKKLTLDVDLTLNQLNKGKHIPWQAITDTLEQPKAIISNYKLYTGVEFKPTKKIALAVGPTLNFMVGNLNSLNYSSTYATIRPNYLYSKTKINSAELKVWIGAKIGIRFL